MNTYWGEFKQQKCVFSLVTQIPIVHGETWLSEAGSTSFKMVLRKSMLHCHTASFWNITIQLTSHDDLTEKLVSLVSSAKLVKWQNVKLHFVIWQKNCLCLTSLDDQIFKSFWKSNPWMNLLEKNFYYISFYSSFCRASPFHREWLALINILMI